MAKYFDRDTKVAYVEQINSGKMTVTEVANELGSLRLDQISALQKMKILLERRKLSAESWINQSAIGVIPMAD